MMEGKRTGLEKWKDRIFIVKDNRIAGISIPASICLLVLIFLSVFIYFKIKTKPEPLKTDNISNKFVYKVTTVKLRNLEEEVMLPGKITFDQNRVVNVFPIVSGKVEDVKVTLGTYVKKGENLARVNSADISDILKDYKVAKSNYDIANKNYKVAERLYKSGFNSELDLINARKEFQKSEDELKKTEDVVKLYGTNPNSKIPYFTITAPIEGYVVEKNINNNMLLRPDNTNAIFTISDLKTVWVYANAFETDIAQLKQGQTVTVMTPAYPNQELKGIINNVGNVLDPTSKALKLRVELENPDGMLRPEMFAKVKVHVPKPGKFLAVPPDALIFDKDKYYVLQYTNKQFKPREIQLVEKTSRITYLLKGVSEGDTIVTEGSLLLYNQIANRL
jgi:cobalt-zinc-cadmium efflux system membrane fusion protein